MNTILSSLNGFLRAADAMELLAHLGINVLVAGLVVCGVYYRFYRNRDYVFTYLLINVITFSLAYVLSHVPVELGFALGLFAVFGILRYRAEAIKVRDLTYLFVVIGIALLNSLATGGISPAELVISNAVIVGAVVALETAPFSRREQSRLVHDDRLDLLNPATASELLADLRRRTHLPVDRFEIGDIDLLRDAALITVYWPHENAGHPRHAPAALSQELSSRLP